MTSTAAEIHVTDTDIRAVMVGHELLNVTDVVVSYADLTRANTPGAPVSAAGLWLAATIQGGPNNGRRLVCPVRAIDLVITAQPAPVP